MKAIRLKIATGAFVLWLAGGNALPAFAQQIDPALTGAVTAQTLELKSLHDKRRKTQEKIIGRNRRDGRPRPGTQRGR